MLDIQYVSGDKYIEDVKLLFKEYSKIKGAEVCFVSFENELAHLEQIYKEPFGKIYIAYLEDQPIGCVAIKPIDDKQCEMKRLYVKPDFRKRGVAKSLIKNAMIFARNNNYRVLRLETLHEVMEDAIKLYRDLGFKTVSDENGLLTMEIELA